MIGLFHYWINIKLYHWTTKNYARHTATDTLLTALLPMIDKLAEVYISTDTGRRHFTQDAIAPVIPTCMTDTQVDAFILDFRKYVQHDVVPRIEGIQELRTITDDILNEINQYRYRSNLS